MNYATAQPNLNTSSAAGPNNKPMVRHQHNQTVVMNNNAQVNQSVMQVPVNLDVMSDI